jgi:hypothetical protein
MELIMKTTMIKLLGGSCALLLVLSSTGCNSEIKGLLLNQVVGFATAITSAAATSLIQLLLGGSAA